MSFERPFAPMVLTHAPELVLLNRQPPRRILFHQLDAPPQRPLVDLRAVERRVNSRSIWRAGSPPVRITQAPLRPGSTPALRPRDLRALPALRGADLSGRRAALRQRGVQGVGGRGPAGRPRRVRRGHGGVGLPSTRKTASRTSSSVTSGTSERSMSSSRCPATSTAAAQRSCRVSPFILPARSVGRTRAARSTGC